MEIVFEIFPKQVQKAPSRLRGIAWGEGHARCGRCRARRSHEVAALFVNFSGREIGNIETKEQTKIID